jgi:hypothetical protein
MPFVSYPSTLPPPSGGGWVVALRDPVARSSLPGNPQARRRWGDAVADVTSATWHYSAAEMAVWRAWWHETLLDGQLWFAKEAPGAGGWVDRVMRFRPASVRVQPLGNGACRVSAQLEQRGRSAEPFLREVSDTTWSPTDKSAEVVLSGGNLVATFPSGGPNMGLFTTAQYTEGRYYFEVEITALGDEHPANAVGVRRAADGVINPGTYATLMTSGQVREDGALNGVEHGVPLEAGDVVGVAFALDLRLVWFYVNGVILRAGEGADPVAGVAESAALTAPLGDVWTGYATLGNGEPGIVRTLNCGAAGFAHTPPSGYDAL